MNQTLVGGGKNKEVHVSENCSVEEKLTYY